jgi:uncharacterized protein (DUF2147 family)
MMRLLPAILLLTLAFAPCVHAASPALDGDWREPGGSIIHIAPCGADICATLVAIRANAPSRLDIHNPDPAQRSHPLCGLVIGRSFHKTSPDHAEGGMLYDPKSGKTYHGEMTVAGDKLDLRGYVGLKVFGRTETWTRTQDTKPCAANS